ncbi:hypothetical protein [uncultured Roseibium sp.]|uniref:hypothetical protein n=1 Tax=uncultured Roseibium sp. TaxID=1936171 RepID=UPI002601F9A7|nr:hypothetical protein [uncultured Roseibium sp.]
MNSPVIDMTNVSVLEPVPVTNLRAELEKFSGLPPYVSIGQAAKIMQITSQGARLLHDRCNEVCAGRNDIGHRIFRRDGCVAYRWSRMSFGNLSDKAEQGEWPDE